jgi:ubiquinone/menaquinone biosynthesis C-methylase UbiE
MYQVAAGATIAAKDDRRTTMTTATRSYGWQLDTDGARAYEANLVPAALDPWAADLVATVDLQPDDRVIDVACGTGIIARHVAPVVGAGGQVTGVDINPAMLAVAREVTALLDTPTEWLRADAVDLPLPTGAFDAGFCQQAVQFFAEPDAALRELHRVIRPGGRVGIATCRPLAHQPGYAILAEIVERHAGTEAAEVVRSPYARGDTAQLRGLLEATGFAEPHAHFVVTPFRFPSAHALLVAETSSSPLGDLTATLEEGQREALLTDLARAMRPHTDDEGVLFPFETVVVTADRP